MCKLQIQNNCSCLTCKQGLSSDHTGNDSSEDRNRNCRRTGGIPTRKGARDQITNLRILSDAQTKGTRAPATMCALSMDFKKVFDSTAPPWFTLGDWHGVIICTWLTCLPNCTLSEWFRIRTGVRQCCAVSPYILVRHPSSGDSDEGDSWWISWCGQPLDRGRLKNKTEQNVQFYQSLGCNVNENIFYLACVEIKCEEGHHGCIYAIDCRLTSWTHAAGSSLLTNYEIRDRN